MHTEHDTLAAWLARYAGRVALAAWLASAALLYGAWEIASALMRVSSANADMTIAGMSLMAGGIVALALYWEHR